MNVIENVSIRQNVYEFLLVYNSNRRPISRTVSDLNGHSLRNSHIYSTNTFFAPN